MVGVPNMTLEPLFKLSQEGRSVEENEKSVVVSAEQPGPIAVKPKLYGVLIAAVEAYRRCLRSGPEGPIRQASTGRGAAKRA